MSLNISTHAGGTEDLAACILGVWGQDVCWDAKLRLVRRVIAGMRVFCAPEALGEGGSFNSALHSIPQLSISPRLHTRRICSRASDLQKERSLLGNRSLRPVEIDRWGTRGVRERRAVCGSARAAVAVAAAVNLRETDSASAQRRVP